MQATEQHIAFVIRGVVEQALSDAGANALRLIGPPTAASPLIERWCGVSFEDTESALSIVPATKTELLLADIETGADLCPLGDLYASEVSLFTDTEVLDPQLRELAGLAGGVAHLDASLRKLLDERRPPDAAFADLPHIRDAVLMRLQKTRFRRARLGIVPKLGARTIGIDLYI